MELKEYLSVLSKYRMTFITIWIVVISLGLISVSLIPEQYRATFSIDITRDVQEEGIQEYEYDQFYRLEADDRFGKTIVQWFKDAAITNEIYAVAQKTGESFKDHKFKTKFRAEKLANSYVKVTFSSSDQKDIQPIFLGVKKVMKGKTTEFNGGFNKQNSFKLIFNGPTIENVKIPFIPLLIGLIGGGFFLATFGIMIRKYLE